MEDSNVESYEWWEMAKMQFKEKMIKNLATWMKDEDRYRRHLSVFMKAFSNFMQKDPGSLEPFNQVHEAKEEAQCNGIAQEQQEEITHDPKGGRHDHQNEEVEEQIQKISYTRSKEDN